MEAAWAPFRGRTLGEALHTYTPDCLASPRECEATNRIAEPARKRLFDALKTQLRKGYETRVQ